MHGSGRSVTFQQPEVPLLHELVKPDPGVLNSSQVSNDSVRALAQSFEREPR